MTRTKRQSQLRAQHRKGPFSPGKPGALSGSMALDHQEFKGRRVVNPSAVSQSSTHPPPSPLALGNPGLLNGRMALDHQDYKGSSVVSSSIRSSENPEAPKSRNPPSKHASGTAKEIARLQKKLGCDEGVDKRTPAPLAHAKPHARWGLACTPARQRKLACGPARQSTECRPACRSARQGFAAVP
ncbi:hypothetical protein PGT21_005641 [Puccinia graminis f. sp. tritici]|uniref:Uncharacterized protein n=1 Tax=Puccinia graminis f. sp. tritici TaxID=56615 RepID=A0A5B0PX33_PUCGR|nr:hypothetical protein PGTUg99_024964 [Puccinia graminis f. sp. tritici]KAA1105394.1 hypothetical protein PGT21_005641 [Puccinia graminis f. sp. tritici]